MVRPLRSRKPIRAISPAPFGVLRHCSRTFEAQNRDGVAHGRPKAPSCAAPWRVWRLGVPDSGESAGVWNDRSPPRRWSQRAQIRVTLSEVLPAIGRDGRAGDEAGVVGGEEEDAAGDLLR